MLISTTDRRVVRSRAAVAVTLAALLLGSGWAEARGATPPRAGAPALTPVLMSVPSPPRWYAGDDGATHVAYELLLTNATPVPVTVAALEVRDGRRVLQRLAGPALTGALGWPDVATDAPTTQIGPYGVGVAWIDLALPARAPVPARLEHRLTIAVPPVPSVPSTITITAARVRVSPRPATVISPPVPGGRWAAVIGPHRRALQPVDGALDNGQRFAIDFAARLDAEGRTHVGPAHRNESYLNYGQPVVAVADGRVVEAVDGQPDQVPNAPQPLPLDAADGNHVILRLGPGVFAAYGHLKRGSVRIRPGQRVRAGQVLGALGNSGASTGPHLHFQLATRPSFLAADGLPFVFARFRLDGRVSSLQTFLEADLDGTPMPIDAVGAGARRRAGIAGLDIVSFAGGP